MQDNYANAHGALRISTKRFEASPFAARYTTPDTLHGVYCNRLYALSSAADPIAAYWQLRRSAMLYDVPEKPLEVKGPDALVLLERVLSRRIASLKDWRARYAIACTPQGGVLMDGVVIRLASDHFWFVQADGVFEPWLWAHADGLAVEVRDPRSRVLQVQGPASLDILAAASDTPLPEPFSYFHAARLSLGGQILLVTRTGWTGELGVEIYAEAERTDHDALWNHLMTCGKPFGLDCGALDSMGIRRIEAGILDNGTDMDPSMTPYEAGLGAFIDPDKGDFVGRSALATADHGCLLFGLICKARAPLAGMAVMDGEQQVGRMSTGAWTPYLEVGVGFVRFHVPGEWPGRKLTLLDQRGEHHQCDIVTLPFFDPHKRIPRGLAPSLPAH